MSLLAGKLLVALLILQCGLELQGLFMRFTNVTCESKDLSMGTIEYCEMKSLGKNKNSVRSRYRMLKPVSNSIEFHLQLMTRRSHSSNEAPIWQPFLYAVKIDMCQFGKSRYNYLARKIFEILKRHSNLNHSCPYSKDEFIAIDDITNVEVSSQMNGIPLAKGFYSLFSRWFSDNQTRVESNWIFEVLSV